MTATMQTEIPALLAPLERAGDKEAIRFGERALSYRELRDVAAQLAQRLAGCERVAVWATPSLETCVSVVGALTAGIPVVPINPKSGERELGHIVDDSEPSLVLAAPDAELPAALDQLERLDVELSGSDQPLPGEARPRVAGARGLHVGHDWAAQGRAVAAPRGRLQPGRAGTGLAVDRRRRADPRPAAVSRARARARRARAPAARRHRAPPRNVLHRGGGGRARRRRRDDAVRRTDDVPPPRRRRRVGPGSRRRSQAGPPAGLRIGGAVDDRPRADRIGEPRNGWWSAMA